MIFITDIQSDIAEKYTIGGKAANLFRLKKTGLTVPKWIVIPQETFSSIVPLSLHGDSYANIISFINSYSVPQYFINEVINQFPVKTFFAVRSSAIDEDGNDFSFAGQFESYLFVTAEKLEESIKKVWCSAFSERVYLYRKNNKLEQKFGIAVIIQEMINSEVAGVAFGINPVNGDYNTKIVSAVYGLGDGLVSGELNADNFIVKDNFISIQIANKTHQYVFNYESGSGTRKADVEENKREQQSISDSHIREIISILDLCHKEYKKPQDIEFAILKKKIYLLQSRPITGIHKTPNHKGEYIVWDNSNIIESYPGVTTPLTFSFISKSYEVAYNFANTWEWKMLL
jgi:rifampicin phosphotransferase